MTYDRSVPDPVHDAAAAEAEWEGYAPGERQAGADRLDFATADRVLRRAVELQAAGDDAAEAELSEDVLVRIAAEVGVSEANLRRALAEVQATPAAEGGAWGRLLAPDRVSVSELIARQEDEVVAALAGWMRQVQGMRLRRRTEHGGLWEKDTHLVTRLRMGLRMQRPPALRSAGGVSHTVRPAGRDEQLVEMGADTEGLRQIGQVLLAAGAAVGGVAAASAVAGLEGAAQVGALAGIAAGLAAWSGTVVWRVRSRVRRIRDALRRAVDCAADPDLAAGGSLRAQLDRLQRDWAGGGRNGR